MQAVNSLFSALGYTVLGSTDGVYHLKARGGSQTYVAMLWASGPLEPDSKAVTLLLFQLEPSMPADRVLEHWRNVDARRLCEPDVATVLVDLPAGSVPTVSPEVSFVRPDGSSLRYGTRLATGDVVCFN